MFGKKIKVQRTSKEIVPHKRRILFYCVTNIVGLCIILYAVNSERPNAGEIAFLGVIIVFISTTWTALWTWGYIYLGEEVRENLEANPLLKHLILIWREDE